MNEPASQRQTYDLTRASHDYPVWHGPPLRTILLCSHPRSGSTLLGEALAFAGGLGCPLEYFHAGFRPGFQHRWNAPDMRSLLDAVRRNRTGPNGTLAVKFFWRDLVDLSEAIGGGSFRSMREASPATLDDTVYRALFALLADAFPNPTFIHLNRLDRVRQGVSGLTAVATGRWRDIPGLPVRDGFAEHPEYDFERIDQLVQFARVCDAHWDRMFAANCLVPYRLSYETLVADFKGAVGPLLESLGSTADPASPRMQRQANELNETMVLRYLRELATLQEGV